MPGLERDPRIEQILSDPQRYFAVARQRAEATVRAEIARERVAAAQAQRGTTTLPEALRRAFRRAARPRPQRRSQPSTAYDLAAARRELEARLESRWGPTTTATDRELRVGDGWVPIVAELVDTLNESLPRGWRVLTVGSKWGELRVRARPVVHDDRHELSRLVAAAARRASRVCEMCGHPSREAAHGHGPRSRCSTQHP